MFIFATLCVHFIQYSVNINIIHLKISTEVSDRIQMRYYMSWVPQTINKNKNRKSVTLFPGFLDLFGRFFSSRFYKKSF